MSLGHDAQYQRHDGHHDSQSEKTQGQTLHSDELLQQHQHRVLGRAELDRELGDHRREQRDQHGGDRAGDEGADGRSGQRGTRTAGVVGTSNTGGRRVASVVIGSQLLSR